MTERFELFRLSLLSREQKDLFGEEIPTREGYLRRVFSRNRLIVLRGTSFHYVSMSSDKFSDFIIGRIGRSVETDENTSPEEGLTDVIHTGWRAITIVLDPREHGDGQKIAVQVNKKVGKALSLISGLVGAINDDNPQSAYALKVSPILDTESFWQFATQHEGSITRLTFDSVAPNMFGGSDDLSEELRAFRKAENAERISIELQSKEGLRTDTQRTREAVDYAGKGCGTIRARTKSGRRFNSAKKAAISVVEVISDGSRSTTQKFLEHAHRILNLE